MKNFVYLKSSFIETIKTKERKSYVFLVGFDFKSFLCLLCFKWNSLQFSLPKNNWKTFFFLQKQILFINRLPSFFSVSLLCSYFYFPYQRGLSILRDERTNLKTNFLCYAQAKLTEKTLRFAILNQWNINKNIKFSTFFAS